MLKIGKAILKGLLELALGILFLLAFSLAMWFGSQKLGDKQVNALTKDTINQVEDSIYIEEMNQEATDSIASDSLK